MFGLSFGEILIIAVVAVIFLGPDKLPKAFVDIAKFLKAVKKTINETKDMIDREVHISEIKQEALEYKKQFENEANSIKDNISKDVKINEIADILNEPLETSTIKTLDKTAPDSFEALEKEGKKMAKAIKRKSESKTESKSAKSESKSAQKPRAKKTDSKTESKPRAKKSESKTTKSESKKKPRKTEKKADK